MEKPRFLSKNNTNIAPKCIHLCILPRTAQKGTFLYATTETPDNSDLYLYSFEVQDKVGGENYRKSYYIWHSL